MVSLAVVVVVVFFFCVFCVFVWGEPDPVNLTPKYCCLAIINIFLIRYGYFRSACTLHDKLLILCYPFPIKLMLLPRFFNYLCLQVNYLCRLAPPSSEASEDKTNFHLC